MGFSLNPLKDISSVVQAGEHVAGKVLHAGENAVEDGAKDFAAAMKTAANAVTHMSPAQIGHTALDVVGMVPVVGTVANLANAGWYAAEGDWTDAAWSAVAAIPIEGDVADAAKLGKDAVNIVEDGAKAERIVKDGDEVVGTAENAEKALSAEPKPALEPPPLKYPDGIPPAEGASLTGEVRSSLQIQGRNVAVAEVNVGGRSEMLTGVSGRASPPGTAPAPENPLFTTKASGAMTRAYDSEVKILEDVANGLPSDARGTISLYTERAPCNSCQGVIQQFQERFPGIKVIITHGE
jgi:hypothetical protein